MVKKKVAPIVDTKFTREYTVNVNGFDIVRGDIIKISGQYGLKFKFDSVVTNTETGASWIDCFEVFRGQSQCFRSFTADQIKRIPQKGKRGRKSVSTN